MRVEAGGIAIARPADPTIEINALLTISSIAMERLWLEPVISSALDSSVLHIIILNTLAIMVALAQPVGPIKNKRINLKKMLPIRYLCRHPKVPSVCLKAIARNFTEAQSSSTRWGILKMRSACNCPQFCGLLMSNPKYTLNRV